MKKKLKYIVCRHYLDSRQYVVKNIKENLNPDIFKDFNPWARDIRIFKDKEFYNELITRRDLYADSKEGLM